VVPEDPGDGFRARFLKGVEFLGILVAVIAIVQEFAFEKPRDRVLRQGRLLAQFATLASVTAHPDEKIREETLEIVSPAILGTVELLAAEGVDMEWMVFPTGVELREADFARAKLTLVTLAGADLAGADLSGADLSGANLLAAHLAGANLEGAYLLAAYLFGAELKDAHISGANFRGALGLTQEMLDSVLPSPPPESLPEGLFWPFEEGKDGKWRLKP